MFRRLASTTILLFLLPSAGPVLAGSGPDRVQVEPEQVRIGMFYSGQVIRVKASTPASADVVMRITGREEPLVLKKKGKKYGILWMNVGEVHYEAIPTLYLLRSSRGLDEIAAPEDLRRLNLGFDAIKDRIPAGSKDEARKLFGELVKLQKKAHLFSCEAAGIQLHPAGAGRQEAVGEFFLPAKTPVGDYTIDVFSFQGRDGELIGTAAVHLERSAVVSSITSLAVNHGLLYGCLAVAVAVLAGLFTGWIFGR
jgi:uncharacterized protein (TIGR02186 family)